MNPALIAGAIQGVGKLISGGQQNKYAKRYRAEAQAAAEEAIRAVQREKQEVKDIRADDERRLREATGYDFTKLRDQAIKAGFNPLTVLAATGGAGYDGRGAVLTTPFVSSEGAYARGVDVNMGTAAAVIGSAGYVGEAISAAGQGYFDQRNTDAQLEQERIRTDLMKAELINSATGDRGGYGSTPFGGAARGITASPVASPVSPFDLYSDRPYQVEPETDVPVTKIGTDPWGNKLVTLNDEFLENDFAELAVLPFLAGQYLGIARRWAVNTGIPAAKSRASSWWSTVTADDDAAFSGKPAWDQTDMVFSLGR